MSPTQGAGEGTSKIGQINDVNIISNDFLTRLI